MSNALPRFPGTEGADRDRDCPANQHRHRAKKKCHGSACPQLVGNGLAIENADPELTARDPPEPLSVPRVRDRSDGSVRPVERDEVRAVDEPPLAPVGQGAAYLFRSVVDIDDGPALRHVPCDCGQPAQDGPIVRRPHRAEKRRERKRVERDQVVFSQVAPVFDQTCHRAVDGGSCEVERAIVPESRPEEGRSFGRGEVADGRDAHSLSHGRERDRDPPPRVRRERLEFRENVRQGGAAETNELLRRAFGALAAGADASHGVGRTCPNVDRLGVEEAW